MLKKGTRVRIVRNAHSPLGTGTIVGVETYYTVREDDSFIFRHSAQDIRGIKVVVLPRELIFKKSAVGEEL